GQLLMCADRDIEQAADTAADPLVDQLVKALVHRYGSDWPVAQFYEEIEVLLPVVVAYADAQVAAERERIAAAIWATIPLPGRDTDVEARAYRDAARIAARIARGVP
ncbi:MAG: hypothetical protein ACRD0W_25400, partial [Acidimicrobiales bacterium]